MNASTEPNMRDTGADAPFSEVTVISCTPAAWLESSHRMGEDLMRAIGAERFEVVTAPTREAFFGAFANADGAVLLHLHGSAVGLYDEDRNGGTPVIVSSEDLSALPENPRVRLLVSTACEVASGDPEGNAAALLSRKIAEDGLLLANRFVVVGASTVFSASEGRAGWVTYSGGFPVADPDELPREIRMSDLPSLWEAHRRRRAALCGTATVTVIGCRNPNWAASSEKMGRDLAAAIGSGATSTVKCPANAAEFGRVWELCGPAVIVHTYGTETALCEDLGDRMQPFVTLDALSLLPQNRAVGLVVITAGSAAGGEENLAACLSEKIAPNGTVIACRGGVFGADTEFFAADGAFGWTVCRNGVRILGDGALPTVLTMRSAWQIFGALGGKA